MSTRKLTVLWKKASDAEPMRAVIYTVEVPVVERSTTPVEDAILGVQEQKWYCKSDETIDPEDLRVEIAEAMETPPADDRVISELRAWVAGRTAKKNARERAESEERAARAAREAADRVALISRVLSGEAILDKICTTRYQSGNRPDLLSFSGDDQDDLDKVEQIKTMVAAENDRRNAAHDASEAIKAQANQARDDYQSTWIAEHGSGTLKSQVAQGYDGYQLFLHEKLEADIPGAELNNNGEDTLIASPTSEQLAVEHRIAEQIARVEGSEKPDYTRVQVVKITQECDECDEPDSAIYVAAEWSPYPRALGGKVYNIRILVE